MSSININSLSESINNKADRDLGNLSSLEGENHFINPTLTNSPYTTNRILEIPQNIKLELSSGTLTLKAGSKVYIPNGFETDGTTPKFDIVNITNDLPVTPTNAGSNLVIYWIDNDVATIINVLTEYCVSGATAPGNGYYIWFDTTDNKIKFSVSRNNAWVEKNISFPICLGTTVKDSGMTSIDQVFNGTGYIGSTVFALPGVKVQLAAGENDNGTCIGEVKTLTSVLTHTLSGNAPAYVVLRLWNDNLTLQHSYMSNAFFQKQQPTSTTKYVSWFDGIKWRVYYNGSWVENFWSLIVLATDDFTNSKISAFNPYGISAVNTYSTSELAEMGMLSSKYETLTLGASYSQYIAPANGTFFVRKLSSASGQYLAVYYRDTDNNPIGFNAWSSGANQTLTIMLEVQKGTKVQIDYSASGATNLFQFIYAQGEA